MVLATQPISPTDITQRIATWTNAVRLDGDRLRLVTAFLPAPQFVPLSRKGATDRTRPANATARTRFPGFRTAR